MPKEFDVTATIALPDDIDREFIALLVEFQCAQVERVDIDAEQTGKNAFGQSVWIGGRLVPLVYLKNGSVLIPAAKYADGQRLLESLRPPR